MTVHDNTWVREKSKKMERKVRCIRIHLMRRTFYSTGYGKPSGDRFSVLTTDSEKSKMEK